MLTNSVSVFSDEYVPNKYKPIAIEMGKEHIILCHMAGLAGTKGDIVGRNDSGQNFIRPGYLLGNAYSTLAHNLWTTDEYEKEVIGNMNVMYDKFIKLDQKTKSQIFVNCLEEESKKLDDLFKEMMILHKI